MSKQTFFYGTSNDIKSLISLVEQNNKLDYCLAGLLDQAEMRNYSSLLELPLIGIAKSQDEDFCEAFLVTYEQTQVNVREVKQSKGGVKYAIDQLINPNQSLLDPVDRKQK